MISHMINVHCHHTQKKKKNLNTSLVCYIQKMHHLFPAHAPAQKIKMPDVGLALCCGMVRKDQMMSNQQTTILKHRGDEPVHNSCSW